MTRSIRLRTALLAGVLAFGACGGGSDGATSAIDNKGNSGAAQGNGADGGGGAGAQTGGGGSNAGGQAPPQGSGSDGKPGSPSGGTPGASSGEQKPLPVKVALASQCLKPGESQTITFATVPRSAVGYNAKYSDGKTGMDKAEHYGGNNGAVVPEDGVWRDTWVIAPNAPAGTVEVMYSATNIGYQPVQSQISFTLVPATGSCPAS